MIQLSAWLKRHRAGAGVIAALALFFAVGLVQLRLPGLQYDEAADGVQALDVILGRKPTSVSTFMLAGRELPLMMLNHIGPTTIYTSLAGFTLLGVSVESLRITQLIIGGLVIVLAWALARSWFGDRSATLTALLCATSPVFIWWSRAGANWTIPLLPLALGVLLALTRWERGRGGRGWLALAAFLFGAGVMTKILFLWLAPLIALTAMLARGPRGVWRAVRDAGVPGLGLAGLACALGMAPLLVHNLADAATLRFILANAGQTQIYGHDNLAFGANLVWVVSDYLRAMSGDTLNFVAPGPPLPLGALVWAAALAWGAASLVRGYRRDGRVTDARLLLLVLAPVVVLPESTVSTSGIGATYAFVIMPLSWMLIARAVDVASGWLARRGALLATVGLLALPAWQLGLDAGFHAFLAQTGGRGIWSDAIYRLTDTLETRFSDRKWMALDWGFSRSITLLARDHRAVPEMHGYTPAPEPSYLHDCMQQLTQPGWLYLVHPPELTFFRGRWELCLRAASRLRLEPVLEDTERTREGDVNALIYSMRVRPALSGLPADVPARGATLGGQVTLLGGRADYDPGRRELALRLVWQAGGAPLPDAVVLVHIVSERTGQVVLVADDRPLYGSYPFSAWKPGEIVADERWVDLPAELASGPYQVRVGVYDPGSGIRLAISDPLNDAAGDSLRLASFGVE